MKKFVAKTLEEAYELATSELNCSITDLKIEVVESGSKGFFGLFAKDAVILAKVANSDCEANFPRKPKHQRRSKSVDSKNNISEQQDTIEKQAPVNKILQAEDVVEEKIFDDFYSSNDIKETHDSITIKKDDDTIVTEIKAKIDELFSHTCYKLDDTKVCFYDSETIYVEFQGDDAALLIGKEGYRYKALSYILFNWIHEKYNLMLRLEVAQFLTTQEESIYNYLKPVIENVKENGFYKTKPLDGVLVHIALKKLRDEFPQKYVAVKTNVKGDKYILINEYKN